jgi:hypothetical protein
MSSELCISENEITAEKIFELFKSAFFDVEISDKGTIIVNDIFRVYITLDTKDGYLRFVNFTPLKKSKTELQKLQFVNRANATWLMIRFYIEPEGDLLSDYSLFYKENLTASQIVTIYRRFVSILLEVRSHKTEDPDCVIGSD